MSFNITIDATTATPTYFNSGADFAADQYLVQYNQGAWIWDNSATDKYLVGLLVGNNGSINIFGMGISQPPIGQRYTTQALAEAAAPEGKYIVYQHSGGTPIGCLVVDSAYGDNLNGSPSPQLTITDLPITFTATPTVTCSTRAITLSWDVPAAAYVSTTVTITVLGVVSASGTAIVYPEAATNWTLTAVNSAGTITASASVTFPANMIVLPTPNETAVYFNGGADYVAGVYLITCCGGAFSWDGSAVGINANDRAFNTSQAFKVTSGQGVAIDAPGSYPDYVTLANSDSANNGLTQILNHNGGPIGVYLNIADYDQATEQIEVPGFSITGPAPTVSLTANNSAVIAGTSVDLVWAVTGSTDTNGITITTLGIVASSGTQGVSPTVTTRYVLIAVYAGLTVTTYADVLIGAPSVPVAVATPHGGGTVTFDWTAPAFTTNTLIERSTLPTSGFSQIASAVAGTITYTETPPLAGTTYYYRLRNTDGTNYGGYGETIATASLVVPIAVSDLSVTSPTGAPVLTWTAAASAISYLLKSGTASGQLTTAYTIPVTGGQTVTAMDPTAASGVLTYYSVVGVNSCGNSVASNEVSITPGAPSRPYVT